MGTGQQADRTVFDIRVQSDMDSRRGRHGDVTSLLVLPREDSVMAYDGYIMEPETGGIESKPNTRCVKITKMRPCTVISIACIVVLVGFVGVCVLYKVLHNKSNAVIDTYSGLASGLNGNIEINGYGLDIRINPEGSACEGPSCISCRDEVSAFHNLSEAKHCDNSSNVKNATCYLCGDECKTFDELLGIDRTTLQCGRGRPHHIDCCILSQMGNLNNYCGDGGTHICLPLESKPTCKCQDGKSGDRCQQSNMLPVTCRCYKPAYQFCDEEGMADCNSDTKGPDWSRCHMLTERNGERHNCICNRTTDDNDGLGVNMPLCHTPHTDAQIIETNGSSKLHLGVSTFIMLTIRLLVDKT